MPPKISHDNVDAVDEAGEGDLKEEDEVRIIQIVRRVFQINSLYFDYNYNYKMKSCLCW